MVGTGARWTYNSDFGPIDIELRAGPVDAATASETLSRLRVLVHAFVYRNADARRIVLEICARLRGMPARSMFGGAHEFDTGSGRAEALGDEVLRAGTSGRLVAARRALRSVIVPLPDAAEAVLGPASDTDAPPPSKSWVGLALTDQDGTPVPNRPYRVIKPDGTTVDGTLDSHGAAMIQDLDPGNCQIWCPYVAPHPASTYVVNDGDHISGIAEANGFDDYTTLWNHPDNADLKSQRTDPHVLQPGDSVAIPEVKDQPATNKPTSAKHPFQIQRSPLKVRLTMLDLTVKAMTSASVTVDDAPYTTDGSGLVEVNVDKSAKGSTLVSGSNQVSLTLGGLNPSDDTSDAGYKARLYNMGFLWDSTVDESSNEMLIALQDFQAQYSLTVSGQLDDATKSQLVQSHGC